MQSDAIATVITKHQIFEAPGVTFKQYVGPATIRESGSLVSGDVLVDVETKSIFYINREGGLVRWMSVVAAMDTRHPSIHRHYILVPLQNRFGWLSATGYAQWCIQALDLNPSDLPAGYIAQIRSAADEYSRHNSGSGMDVDSNIDADVDVYSETDNGAVPVLRL